MFLSQQQIVSHEGSEIVSGICCQKRLLIVATLIVFRAVLA